jgi:hypothetical protein
MNRLLRALVTDEPFYQEDALRRRGLLPDLCATLENAVAARGVIV